MVDDLSFRLATLEEKHALEELQWRASLMWDEYRDALLAHPDAIELSDNHITEGGTIIAERIGETLGFAVVLIGPHGNVELDGLFVEPHAWRCGIGRSLVAQAQQLPVVQGAEAMYVVANPRASGFYIACGFVQIGEARTRFGVGLRMRKEIDARERQL
ncbi:MAG TPA: GNAT family N-acetyltransferase [Methyloceanibacter sp.]|nr:GNAT family N-acetyltransferase [Methyloceanibacter sp.]